MKIVKMGTAHKENDINCQDAVGSYKDIIKIVCDGCSEGKHSEVGAKLFCEMFIKKYSEFINKGKSPMHVPTLMVIVIDELIQFIGNDAQTIKDYLSFTVLIATKTPGDNCFHVYYCGDGYIIVDNNNEGITLKKIDYGEYPKYLAYNYINSSLMKEYGTGVEIDEMILENCKNVGVASDGIRFVAELDDDSELKKEFKQILSDGKEIKMKLFFNRNSKLFQDDFSIVF